MYSNREDDVVFTLTQAKDKLTNVGNIISKAQAEQDLSLVDKAEKMLIQAMDMLEINGFNTYCTGRMCAAEDVDQIQRHPSVYGALQTYLDDVMMSTGTRPNPTLVVANPKTKVMIAIDERDFSSHIFY